MVRMNTGDGGKSSDTISVDPQALKSTSPTFLQVGQQVSTIQQTVENSVQIGSIEMFMIMEFAMCVRQVWLEWPAGLRGRLSGSKRV